MRTPAKAPDPGGLGEPGQPYARAMINAVGDIGIEIAQGIIGQGGKVNDGIETFQVFRVGVPHIFLNMRHLSNGPAGGKRAICIEVAVKADDFMARSEQHRHHSGADVTQMSSHKHAHELFSLLLGSCEAGCHPAFRPTAGAGICNVPGRQGMLPFSTMSSSTSLSFKVSMGRQKPSCLKASS